MALQIYVFLLMFFLILTLAWLWRHGWLPLQPSHFKTGAVCTTVHRLLKPRTPDDCPVFRLATTPSLGVGPAPGPVRPWREVKSRRGARHSDTHRRLRLSQPTMRVLRDHRCAPPRAGWRWQAWPGRTHPDLSLSVLPRHLQCPTRRALVPVENPLPCRVAMVLTALAEGLDPISPLNGSSATDRQPSRPGCRAQPVHAQTLHERSFRHLWLPHLQLDELRTRLRSAKQILWLWLAIDPLTKILPVLELGHRTQHMAHQVIHSLRQSLAAFLPPALYQ